MPLALIVGCSGGAKPVTDPTEPSGSGAPRLGSASDTTGVPAETPDQIGVALTISPPDATVTVDDTPLGAASELDPVISLAAGLHTLVVSKPGFKSYRAEFSVTDRTETFTVKLERDK